METYKAPLTRAQRRRTVYGMPGVSIFGVCQDFRCLPHCVKCRRSLAMRIISVRLSVHPSNAWIVTKRKKIQSRFLYHEIGFGKVMAKNKVAPFSGHSVEILATYQCSLQNSFRKRLTLHFVFRKVETGIRLSFVSFTHVILESGSCTVLPNRSTNISVLLPYILAYKPIIFG